MQSFVSLNMVDSGIDVLIGNPWSSQDSPRYGRSWISSCIWKSAF